MEPRAYEEMAQVEQTHWWYRGRRAAVEGLLSRFLPEASERRLLDVGCGTGGNLNAWKRFGQVVGMDLSLQALQHARHKGGEGMLVRGRLPDAIPFAEGSFAGVIATDVLEHIPDDVGTIQALLDLLQPGGRLFLTVPGWPSLWGPHDEVHHHLRRYRGAELQKVVEAGGGRLVWRSGYIVSLLPMAIAQRLLSGGSDGERLPSPWLNRLLTAWVQAEGRLATHIPFPTGLSRIAVVERRENSSVG